MQANEFFKLPAKISAKLAKLKSWGVTFGDEGLSSI
jgi:hypothetical protein